MSLLLALTCLRPLALGHQDTSAADALAAAAVAAEHAAEGTGLGDPGLDDGSAWTAVSDLPDDTHDVALLAWRPRTVKHALIHWPAPACYEAHVDTLLRPPSA